MLTINAHIKFLWNSLLLPNSINNLTAGRISEDSHVFYQFRATVIVFVQGRRGLIVKSIKLSGKPSSISL